MPNVETSKEVCTDCQGTGSCCTSCGEPDEYCYCDQEERDIRRCYECYGTGTIKK